MSIHEIAFIIVIFISIIVIANIYESIKRRRILKTHQSEIASELKFNRSMANVFGDVFVKEHGYCRCSRCKGLSKINAHSYIKDGKVYYSAECHFCKRVTEINQNEIVFLSDYS